MDVDSNPHDEVQAFFVEAESKEKIVPTMKLLTKIMDNVIRNPLEMRY